MANYGFKDLAVKLDSAAGTLTDMSQFVTSINGVVIEAVTEESHAAGDQWVENLFAGLRRMQNVVLGGFYDDVAGGPNAVFNNPGGVGDTNPTRTLEITYGSTKKTTVEVIILRFTRSPVRGETTKFEVELLPTGAVVEA